MSGCFGPEVERRSPEKGREGTWGDGNIPYLDCHGGYVTVFA